MTLMTQDPLTQLAFSLYENKGVFAVLLGSGLSRSAEIPTGWEITLDLVRRVALAQGVEEQADWAEWYRTTTGEEPNYSTLLEDIAISPDERRAILHRYIEPTSEEREAGRKLPTAAHRAIAKLVAAGYIRVILTTNFDRLMENALREQGVEPTVVSSEDSLLGAEPLTHSRCYLLKLHGDYKDARILNTDRELSAYPDGYNRLLDRICDEHGLVICGWSGEWDHALRAAFLRAPNRRYPTFWAVRGALGAGAQGLADQRRARTVTITGADDFFCALQQRVETQEQSQRQNPLSVELLVSSTKRFLAKPEFRIQLDDLFAQEAERLLALLDTDEFSPQTPWGEGEFRRRTQRYEALSEAVARMSGVAGRWGDGSELPVILDLINALYSHAQKVGSGGAIWLSLREYPAVLIMTAYGLGATRASRWRPLHTLFTHPLVQRHGAPASVVHTLFLWTWSGGEQNIWRSLEGFDRRKTPLSDHLLAVMEHWKSSFAGMATGFELLFDTFEVLGAMAHFEDNAEEALEAQLALRTSELLTWMPIGRVGWNGSSASKLLQTLEDVALPQALLAEGFSHGRLRFHELFVENLKRAVRRMSW